MESHAENRLPGAAPFTEAELAERFSERLRLFAARRIGDASAAEDVAQETLRRVVESLRANRIENVAALPGFVFQTARNICMHWARSINREQQALSRFESQSSGATAEGSDALNEIITEERRALVRAALASLRDDDRSLLSMLYYDGLDSEAVATRLDLALPAVRVRKHRALRRLAELLGVPAGNESGVTGTLY